MTESRRSLKSAPSSEPVASSRAPFAPRSSRMALETRILFDGAAAVAGADAFEDAGHGEGQASAQAGHAAPDAVVLAATHADVFAGQNEGELSLFDGADASTMENTLDAEELLASVASQGETGATLLVIDARVDGYEDILAQLPSNVQVRVVETNESGYTAISQALAGGSTFSSVHIVSHGVSGSLTLGSDAINSASLATQAAQVQGWGDKLTEEADILLYGCDIAQGERGQAFINELAHLTRADIAASTDATGYAEHGGNWVLESATGSIEASMLSLQGLNGVLAAAPTVGFAGLPMGNEVLIGKSFEFGLTFSNPGDDGYGPYIDLYLPSGADGDDGININGITYLGSAVNYQVITLDVNGKALHPYARNTSGQAVEITGQPNQRVVVIEMPFGSYTNGQPATELRVSATLSNHADRGQALAMKAQAGFRYGNTPLADYATDPSLLGVEAAINITPVLVEYTHTFDHAEGETATGPNFTREMTTTIQVAPGQTLSHYVFQVDVPQNVVVTHVNGVALDAPVSGAMLSRDLGAISGSTDVTIRYYVPEVQANQPGSTVLNPDTGAVGVSQFHVSSTSNWTPLDTRDNAEAINYAPVGVEFEHAIKSLAVQKTVTNTTDNQNSPGDVLKYRLDFQVSDYFRFDNVVITDQIEDGHQLSGTPTLVLTYQGVTHNISLAGFYSDSAPDAQHDVTRTFNVSAAVAAYAAANHLTGDIAQGILRGGRFNGDSAGGTFGRIEYNAIIKNSYDSSVTGNPEIDHGDHLKTTAAIEGRLIKADDSIGSQVTDGTATDVEIAGGQLGLDIIWVNGQAFPSGSVDIKPGDQITYELVYDLVTGDFEDLYLDAYLPKPVFDVNGSWTKLAPGDSSSVPGVGEWMLVNTGVTNVNSQVTLGVDAASNGLKFNMGTRDDPANAAGQKVVIRFTVQVSDKPFADGMYLTAQAQATDHNTQQEATTQQKIAQVRLNQPVLEIKHGVVSKTGEGIINDDTTGSWASPGDTGIPFSGTISNIAGMDGNIRSVDAGDKVRWAVGIMNTGGSGAFDIVTNSFQAPNGFKLIQADGSDAADLASANLRIYRGDGTLLVQNTDYTVVGGIITFIDRDTNGDGQVDAVLGRGTDRATGTQVNDGSNVLVITYDTVALSDIAAGRSWQVGTSTAQVVSYAGVDEGVANGTNRLSAPLTDIATAATAGPQVKIVFKDGGISDDDSSAAHTTGNQMVIGETMDYDIVVTLPEGITHNLRVDALVPNGMILDTSFNNGLGYEIITLKGTGSGQSGALGADFAGTVSNAPALSWASGSAGAMGADPRLAFGNVTTDSDNETGNNSFVIRVRAILANTNVSFDVNNPAGNQAGKNRSMDTRLHYDAFNQNGATSTPVIAANNNATITIREPQLLIEKTVDTDTTLTGQQSTPIDAGDTVEYTIRIKHGVGSVDAFDLKFLDTFHSALTMDGTSLIIEKGLGAFEAGTGTNIRSSFVLDSNGLRIIDGQNIDLANGEEIVIKVRGTANATVAMHASFDSQATVSWSSLDSSDNSEAARNPNERDGSGGAGTDAAVLNNYVATDGALVNVAASYELSRIGGLADTVFTGNTSTDTQNVAVGEIVRFRLVMKMPEGQINDLSIKPVLPTGYTLLGDGATWALVGDYAGNFSVNGVAQGATGLVVSDGVASNYGNIENSLNSGNTATASLRPGLALNPDGSGTFILGTIINGDNDPDAEYIVLEFNAVVTNLAGVAAGSTLTTKVEVLSGTTKLGESNSTADTVVEPQISAIDKRVVDMAPGAQGTTAQITVSNSFTTGSTNAAPAYEVKLVDKFPAGTSYSLQSVVINGVTHAAGSLPAGVTWSATDAGGIEVNFGKLDPGTSVNVFYNTTVSTDAAQAANAATNATLTWSSLPDGAGTISETGFAGANVGADGMPTGERDGSGGVNNYSRTDGAGYGVISGILWDDTNNRDGVVDAGEVRLANQTVTLRWAGLDGNFGSADDRVLTVTTNANGEFHFGALAAGNYRIEAPGTITHTFGSGANADTDVLTPRWDADGNASNNLNTIAVTLAEGSTTLNRNVGYLRENDAPSFTGVGGSVSYTEGQNTGTDNNVIGTPVRLTGDVTVNDPELVDQGLDDFNGTTLTVGRSNVANDGFTPNTDDVLAIGTVTVNGLSVTTNSGQVWVDGVAVGTFTSSGGSLVVTFLGSANAGQVNAVASAITYANSSHTPEASVVIRYRFNDANDDNKQGSGGPLTGDATVTVNITAVNDPPVAVNDPNGMTNRQGTATGNVITGSHTSGGGVTSNTGADSDPDTPTANLTISRVEVTTSGHGNATPAQDLSTSSVALTGKYGTLTLNADGSYSYALDAGNADVFGLAQNATLTETFQYTLSDGSLTDTAVLTITITGEAPSAPTITPVDGNGAVNGHNTVYEKGLTSTTDTSETVAGTITVAASGGVDTVTIGSQTFTVAQLNQAATTPIVITTPHGTLTINGFTPKAGEPAGAPREATISYSYTLGGRVDNNTPETEAAASDTISLSVQDRLYVTPTTGSLVIHIIDDVPVAVSDVNSVGEDDTTPVTGNLISGATGGAGQDTVGADGATVTGLQAGTVTSGTHVANGGISSEVTGAYGKVTVNADGSYSYVLDTTHPAVQGLIAGEQLQDVFTYTLTDGDGDKSTATLTITVNGANDDVTVTVPNNHPSAPVVSDKTDHVVFERGLSNGSAPNADDLIVESSFTVKALDGLDPSEAVTIQYLDAQGNPATLTLTKTQLEQLSTTPVTLNTQYGTLLLNSYGQAASGTDKGTITVGYTYTLTQAPAVNATDTTDSFVIGAKDRNGDTDTPKTLNIKIVDDAPVAVNDVNAVGEDDTTPVTGNLINGATGGAGQDTVGADGALVTGLQAGTVTSGTHVANGGIGSEVSGTYGKVTVNADGSYSYVVDTTHPAVQGLIAGETLTEVFTYTLTDKDGDQSTTTLTITVNGANDDVTVTVPNNHPAAPVVSDKTDHVVFERGLNNGSAPNADDLIVESNFTVKALDGLDPSEAVTIQYLDAQGNPATLTLTKTQLEQLSTTSVTVNTQYGTLLLNSYGQAASGTDKGTITVGYTYTLTQAPAVNATDTTDSFVIGAKDRNGDTDTPKTLNIKIVDDAPVTQPDTAELTRGLPDASGNRNTVSGNVYGNDAIGADGSAANGPVTGVVAGQPGGDANGNVGSDVSGSYGKLVLNADGSYTYALDPTHPDVAALLGNQTLTDTFTYTITDADGDTSTTTLTITVRGNTPPVAVDDVRTTPEDTPVSGNVILGNVDGDQPDGDADGNPLVLTQIELDVDGDGTPEVYPVGQTPITVDIPGKGVLVIGRDGGYTFTPVPDWHGSVPPITYTVSDGVDHSDTAVLTITVTPVVDITPDTSTTIAGQPVTTPVLGNDSFEGRNPQVSVEPGNGPAHGTVTVNPDGSITYQPNPGYVGQDVYVYTVTSGGVTESTTVTIDVLNRPPVPTPDTNTVPEDTPATGNVLGNDGTPSNGGVIDADGHPFEVVGFEVGGKSYPPGSVADIPGVGTLTLGKDGNYIFTPVPDWNGQVPTITYTVSDGYPGGEATSTLNITVTPVVDVTPDATQTEANTSVTIDPLANDSFSNPDAKVTEVTQGKFGTVVIEPDGRVTYTPGPSGFGTDTFTYTVTSGGVTETTTVTVDVKPENPVTPPSTPFVDSSRSSIYPSSPLRDSVVNEPSVFFDGTVFDKLPRMDLPFHPIVYVNREVQLSQAMREADDMRMGGNIGLIEAGRSEASLSSQRLAMSHTLYVQDELREAQKQGQRWMARVDGHHSHTELTGDGTLSAPGLPGVGVNGWPTSAVRPQAAEGAQAAQAAPGESAGLDVDAVGSAVLVAMDEAVLLSEEGVAVSVAAPSFSEQLRSGRGHLPGALHAPHDPV